MRLHGINGTSVHLTVGGYQFPGDQTSEYDSNWLLIGGRVRHPRGDWTFRDPCLLTYEAQSLADWLEQIAADSATNSSIQFIEPNLSFETIESCLRIVFDLEARPHWATRDEKIVVECPIVAEHIQRAARRWRDQLAKFPQRGER